MSRTLHSVWWLTILVIGSVVLSACTSGSAGNKAGGDPGPVTLRIGTADYVGRPSANAIQEFAHQAKVLSGGRLIIEPVWQAAGVGVSNWDQTVARMVGDRRLDLGMIPARAWDTEAVTSLRALHAPFLVTSDALADQIVIADLAGEMMAGLDKAGVTGLALLPESLRHPFGFRGRALRSPSDYAGKNFRTPRSELGYATFRALGAMPEDLNGEEGEESVKAGTLVGTETAFVLRQSLQEPAVAVGNVTFNTKVDSLVINSKVLEELPSADRTILRDAAAATLRWVLGHRTPEAEAAKAFCNEGGTIVAASDADLRALRRAVQPVYDELERDAATKRLLDRIGELKRTVRVPAQGIAMPCRPDAHPTPPAASGDPSVLNGTYRFELTKDELRAFGVTDPHDLLLNEGVYTWRLKDGRYVLDQKAPQETDHQEGRYTMAGNRVTFQLPWVNNLELTFAWRISGRNLTFQFDGKTDPPLKAVFTAHPWTRIA
ncbi:TRAP-type C4-dicarboxylate transport system substrate-binding protein [Kribbella antiqua]|uniref:TRAP-type C4-dicarboxylate transport system substrate-binding protein n=1 Tax=Kribbella antiqua TaxID=2512217 RepID=A0A4R2J5U9_9ACTN|nr:TRAP transporter substrate-binding protein DctP [Kribbella antiqua]TCO52006.1 TRAP-type C4-dicarboxylate transport system substrate-binding protein [Kribbella antiqua]